MIVARCSRLLCTNFPTLFSLENSTRDPRVLHPRALSFWDKLADLEILPSQQLYVMKLITRLANFTTTIIPKLSRTEIVSLVSCLRTFTSSVAKIDDSPAFLVAIAIEILTTISDLEWITQIEVEESLK